jgi:Tfp pilus assembly protein PilX
MIQFFNRRFRTRPDGSHDESGLAMIIAITVVMLMTLIPLAVVQGAIGQLPLARHNQDHESALAAAEAGVDDYLFRLAQNSNYWTFSASSPPTPANPAFTGWVAVPGSTASANGECFRYKADSTKTAQTGIVYITSSGKRLTNATQGCSSAGVIRTVSLGLRRQGFLDYLWLTDYEMTDPALSGDNSSTCKFHAWEWNPTASKYGPNDVNNCDVVYWTSTAALNGPVHSNDGLYVCGNPQFLGDTDTYYNSAATAGGGGAPKFAGPGPLSGPGANPNAVLNPLGCSNSPSFGRSGDPASGSLLPFPPANTSIRNQADAALGGAGCLFTGPTTITLLATGKMNVTSPNSLSTNCPATTNMSLPANGVIYVQNVPSGADPNHSVCSGSSCIGDVNVSGVLNGQLTIAAQDDINITGNLTYNQFPGGDDVLGLVADNDVAVVHPSGTDVTNDLTIDAAIMSLNHSFYVQNWASGSNAACSVANPCAVPGVHSLIINGVVTQEFRGPVGTFNPSTGTMQSGYNKAYSYDTRLKYLSPPYFLSPTQSAWMRLSYAEVAPNPAP